MRPSFIVALLVVGSVGPACSVLTSLSGIVPDVSPQDASVDGSLPSDGSTPMDVSDSSPELDGAPPAVRFCATVDASLICDDFDRDGALVAPGFWVVGSGTTGDASLAIVVPSQPPPPSKPNAMLAIANGNETAVVAKQHYSLAGGLSCTFSVRVEQAGSEDAILVALDLYPGGSAYYRLELLGNSGFREYGGLPDGAPLPNNAIGGFFFTQGQWNTVTLEAALGGSAAGHFEVSANGGTPLATASSFDLSALPKPTNEDVIVGIRANSGPDTWKVLFDNVVCSVIP